MNPKNVTTFISIIDSFKPQHVISQAGALDALRLNENLRLESGLIPFFKLGIKKRLKKSTCL